ncbi:MAG: NFACT RNA binding domain-containing protein [Candidatus Diapherotrites archaeon]
MKLEIDFTKKATENATDYFEAAKKAKRKLEGLKKGIEAAELKIKATQNIEKKELKKKREKKWYEKFRWFFTSEGLLAIGGKDATSNEKIINNYMKENDIYFHADIHGAAHIILKCEKSPNENSLKETAIFAAVHSKAWQEKIPTIDVYSAKPTQITKKAPTGETLPKGAFMVYGERTWYKKTKLSYAIGAKKEGEEIEIFAGPESAIEKKADAIVKLTFGNKKKSDCAKKIAWILSTKLKTEIKDKLDEIIALLPNGESEIEED